MKSDPATVHNSGQTERQARHAVIAACAELHDSDLNPVGFIAIGHRWARSGAEGILSTPPGAEYDVSRWQVEDINWHAMSPALAQVPIWQGQLADNSQASDEPWLVLFRGVLAENQATQTVLLLASPYACALACLPRIQNEGLLPVHPAAAAFGPDGVPCAPFVSTGSAALDQQALEAVMPALAVSQACLLANQGMLVTGESLHQAVNRAKTLEGLARIYSLALQMGEPGLLTAGQIGLSFEHWQHPV